MNEKPLDRKALANHYFTPMGSYASEMTDDFAEAVQLLEQLLEFNPDMGFSGNVRLFLDQLRRKVHV